MSKHTPGPCRVAEEDGDGKCQYRSIAKTWVIDSQERHLMAFLQAWKDKEDLSIFDEVRANAHLIAAAPDLLEALIGMVEVFGNAEHVLTLNEVIAAKQAISKARGEIK